MNDLLRGCLAGYGAKKLGGGCFSTIVIFILLWVLLGHCNQGWILTKIFAEFTKCKNRNNENRKGEISWQRNSLHFIILISDFLCFMCYYLYFTGHMEYARLIIISSTVGDLFQSWLFHLFLNFNYQFLVFNPSFQWNNSTAFQYLII